MFSAFANIAKIPDLRRKTLITLGLLVLARVGVFVPLPGVNLDAVLGTLKEQKGSGFVEFLGVLDMFSRRRFEKDVHFCIGHHALHLRLHYFPIAERDHSRAAKSRQRR